jgi:hypothetical protein
VAGTWKMSFDIVMMLEDSIEVLSVMEVRLDILGWR